jgi:hypothetical protein
MSNNVTTRDPDDDGFGGSINSAGGDRINRGTFLKWSDSLGWMDKDGLPLPPGLLVPAIDTALQRWKDNKSQVIRDKPLPDPEELNAAIPKSEWEKGIDGQLRKPWAHIIVMYFINPATGEIYTYTSPTVGARIAYDALREATMTMRVLRGQKVVPVVNLAERPMKTNFGMRKRPHFEIVGWKSLGGDAGGSGSTIAPQPTTPQLEAPTAAPAKTPAAATGQHSAKPKAPVNAGGETLKAMGDVKPVTASEVLDDELPWA